MRLASAAEDTLKARAKDEGYDLRVLHIKKLANDVGIRVVLDSQYERGHRECDR